MTIDELKGKTKDELKALILASKKELLNLRFQKATGELENTSRFKQLKKDIARINTVLSAQKNAA